jgi:hypothetical protein
MNVQQCETGQVVCRVVLMGSGARSVEVLDEAVLFVTHTIYAHVKLTRRGVAKNVGAAEMPDIMFISWL